jgi:antitoxin ParD1/3/4
MLKRSISLTPDHARLLDMAVSSGDYGSVSEVVREALREWKAKRILGQLWDEGIASGKGDMTLEEIKAEARKGMKL